MTFSTTMDLSCKGLTYPTELPALPARTASLDAWSGACVDLPNQQRMADCAVRHLAPAVLFRPWSPSPVAKKEKRRLLPWDADEIQASPRSR